MIELQTNRLLLRKWLISDIDDLYEYAKDNNIGALFYVMNRQRQEKLILTVIFIIVINISKYFLTEYKTYAKIKI